MNPTEFQAATPYASFGTRAIDAPVDARMSFIRKTYSHLAAAVYAFVGLEWLLFALDFDVWMMDKLQGAGPMAGLVLLGGFIAVSWIANRWAMSNASIGMQYAGLFLYVIAEAVIFVPLLMVAQQSTVTIQGLGSVGIIPAAAVTTLVMFGGLTAFVFVTKKDFSFLGSLLTLVMIGAFALILASVFVGFNLGVWFSALMVIAACGWILYDTSNVLHRYRTDQHVAAALALFASVALLFWYVVRIFLSNRD